LELRVCLFDLLHFLKVSLVLDCECSFLLFENDELFFRLSYLLLMHFLFVFECFFELNLKLIIPLHNILKIFSQFYFFLGKMLQNNCKVLCNIFTQICYSNVILKQFFRLFLNSYFFSLDFCFKFSYLFINLLFG
jgi:hypothetical protein